MGFNSYPNQNTVSGTLAQRPAASSVAPGTFHFATDVGILARSDGSLWNTVSLASGSIADGAIRSADIDAAQIQVHHMANAQRFTAGVGAVLDQGGEVVLVSGTCTGVTLPGTGDHNRFRIFNRTAAAITVTSSVAPGDTFAGAATLSIAPGTQLEVIGDDFASNWLVLQETIPLVTALPASPFDGMEIRLQTAAMATAGIVWHLRYNAASALVQKWQFVGGVPLYGFSTGGDQATASESTFATLTGSPSLAAPAPGVYEVRAAMRIQQPLASGLSAANVWPVIGPTVVQDRIASFVSSVQYEAGAAGGSADLTLAAGEVVQAAVSTNNISMNFGKCRLSLTPIRLG